MFMLLRQAIIQTTANNKIIPKPRLNTYGFKRYLM